MHSKNMEYDIMRSTKYYGIDINPRTTNRSVHIYVNLKLLFKPPPTKY